MDQNVLYIWGIRVSIRLRTGRPVHGENGVREYCKKSFLKGLLTQRGYDLIILRVEGISATIACHFHGMKERVWSPLKHFRKKVSKRGWHGVCVLLDCPPLLNSRSFDRPWKERRHCSLKTKFFIKFHTAFDSEAVWLVRVRKTVLGPESIQLVLGSTQRV